MIVVIAAAAAASPLPSFEFKGLVGGEPITGAVELSSEHTYCSKERDIDAQTCILMPKMATNPEEAKNRDNFGGVVIRSTSITLTNGQPPRLYRLAVTFHTNEYDRAVSAFIAKYGPSCATKSATVQSIAGATYPASQTKFCFSGGSATIFQRSGDIYEGEFVYTDERYVPKKTTPDVNF